LILFPELHATLQSENLLVQEVHICKIFIRIRTYPDLKNLGPIVTNRFFKIHHITVRIDLLMEMPRQNEIRIFATSFEFVWL
jgi:hypothetical protein